MEALIHSVRDRIAAAIEFVNGVDSATFQPKILLSADMDTVRRTMVH